MDFNAQHGDTLVKVKIGECEGDACLTCSPDCTNGPAPKKRRTAEPEASSDGRSEGQAPCGLEGKVLKTDFCKCFAANARCLASASVVFKTMLDRWCDSNGQKQTIEVDINAGQLSSFEAMMKFIHTRAAPDRLSPRDMMCLLFMADRFMVDSMVGHCVQGLLSASLGHEMVVELLNKLVSSRIRNLPPVTSLLDVLEGKLLAEFQDLEEVLNSLEKKARFLDLPLPCVKSLLLNDDLKVGAEETVFVAVSEWLDHTFGRSQQLAVDESYRWAALELGGCVRFPQMMRVFNGSPVLKVPWMRWLETSSGWSSWWVREARLFDIFDDGTYASTSAEVRHQHPRFGRGRRFVPRQTSPAPDVLVSLTSAAEVFRTEMAEKGTASFQRMYKGYIWKLSCRWLADSGATVELTVHHPENILHHCSGVNMRIHPSVLPQAVVFEAARRSTQHGRMCRKSFWISEYGDPDPCGFTVKNFFRETSLEAVLGTHSDFVVDGQIRIMAKATWKDPKKRWIFISSSSEDESL